MVEAAFAPFFSTLLVCRNRFFRFSLLSLANERLETQVDRETQAREEIAERALAFRA